MRSKIKNCGAVATEGKITWITLIEMAIWVISPLGLCAMTPIWSIDRKVFEKLLPVVLAVEEISNKKNMEKMLPTNILFRILNNLNKINRGESLQRIQQSLSTHAIISLFRKMIPDNTNSVYIPYSDVYSISALHSK